MNIEDIDISLIIEDNWSGYAINHTRSELDRYYRDGDYFPETEDYRIISRQVALEKVPIFAKFLLVGNIFLLVRDLDDGEILANPHPLVLETYDYGKWDNGLPEKQDKIAQFFIGSFDEEAGETSLTLDSKKRYIPRFKADEDLERIVFRRRRKATDYLKARAKMLGIGQDVVKFFNKFWAEELLYLESGSTNIIDALTLSAEDWLKKVMPTVIAPNNTVRDLIIFYLQQPLVVPSQEEIDKAIIAAYKPEKEMIN